jgi:hypothetical protein
MHNPYRFCYRIDIRLCNRCKKTAESEIYKLKPESFSYKRFAEEQHATHFTEGGIDFIALVQPEKPILLTLAICWFS